MLSGCSHQQYAYSPRGSLSCASERASTRMGSSARSISLCGAASPSIASEAQRLGAQLHHELLAQRQLRLDVLHVVIRAELGELRGRLGRVLEPAEMIDEADALRIDARPDTPLRDLVHILDALLAALADPVQEFVIGMVDGALQDLPRRAVERAIQPHLARERCGAEAVDLDPELLERALERRYHGEHADRARQGGRARENLVRGGGDVVAARRGVGAHGHDHGLTRFAQPLHLAQDELRGEHAAARTVDAQHHRLDRVVVARLAQEVRRAFAADLPGRLMTVEDLARSHHDADPRVGFGFERTLRSRGGEVLAHADRIERMRVGILAHQALHIVGKLAAALERGHQPALQGELGGIAVHRGERRRRFAHVLVERVGSQGARTSDVLTVGVPQRLQPHRALLALARRHIAARELIGETLEGSGAEHVDVHAELVDGILEEHAVVAEAVDIDQSERIEIDLARLGGEVVLRLIERVGRDHDALARGAEIAQRRADLLQLRQTRGR